MVDPLLPRPAWAVIALEAMVDQGLSRTQVASGVGLSSRALRDRLTGRVRPLTSEMARLAEVLKLPIADLVGPAGAEGSGPALELLTERDRQVYAATQEVDGGGELGSTDDVQAYVDGVLAGSWWERWAPGVSRVTVGGLADAGEETPAWHEAALTGGGVTHALYIPAWASRPLTVLHELAHVAAYPILWAKPHGPQFLRLWVDLVGDRMGRQAAAALRTALRADGLGLAGTSAVAAALARGGAELARLLGTESGER